jgi:acyl-CoA synthetase (AMP-forming)/AMP-acid ligase II
VLVAALPRNPSGKVLKTRLRDDHGGAACPT